MHLEGDSLPDLMIFLDKTVTDPIGEMAAAINRLPITSTK